MAKRTECERPETRQEFGNGTTSDLRRNSMIKLEGKTKLIIEGHADYVGSEIFNQGLSERRAMFVTGKMQELKQGKSIKIGFIGYGKKRPIADNSTEDGRAKNRRVDIYAE